MSDQPEADESLPTPPPDETARLMRQGAHSKMPAWKRLLPPWAVSIGLHLFLLMLVLAITVAFADSLFVPTVSEHVRAKQPGNDPHSNLLVDRDYLVEDVLEKSVQLVKLHEPATSRIAMVKEDSVPPNEVADKGMDPIEEDKKLVPTPLVQTNVGADPNLLIVVQPAASVPGGNPMPDLVYLPTPQKVVDEMLKVAKLQPNEVLFDLGSGDGRFPITAAKKFGALGFGYEIDAKLVKESLENAKKQGVSNRVVIEQRDMFKLDLSKADVVSAYMLPSMMVKMIPQFDKMKPGSRLVSHDFDFRYWLDERRVIIEPDKVLEIDAPDDNGKTRTHYIYLWTLPLKKTERQR